MEVYTVSAFSKHGTGGNKAGVVFEANPINQLEKNRIAWSLGYSETAFVSDSQQAD